MRVTLAQAVHGLRQLDADGAASHDGKGCGERFEGEDGLIGVKRH
jgi:hypothetical protein